MNRIERDVKYESLFDSIVKQTSECWNEVNEISAISCILEAIKSGDFYKQIQRKSDLTLSEKYIYKPYAGMEELKNKNEKLQQLNAEMLEELKSIYDNEYLSHPELVKKLLEKAEGMNNEHIF